MRLDDLFAQYPFLMLDGATGTEVQRRGASLTEPLWSAHALLHAPQIVRAIHYDYLHAGADIISTNTFRTSIRALRNAGIGYRWEEMNSRAVQIAFEARDRFLPSRPVVIAGVLAPVEDCYSPERTPTPEELEEEHGRQAELLAMLGVDILLVETMMTHREAMTATRAALATGKEVITSFVCDNSGTLLSGEALQTAARDIAATGASAVLVNCVSARHIMTALGVLRDTCPVPVGCYANIGSPTSGSGDSLHTDTDIETFVQAAQAWLDAGASVIGGCCGTTPAHILGMTQALRPAVLDLQKREIDEWTQRPRHRPSHISLEEDV
jgi:S-methylmethionine-dependent homocysteine/selenocysteine methylase